VGVRTGSDLLGFAAAVCSGAALALVFGLLVVGLDTNQYATGLSLSLFGAGLSAFVGQPFTQEHLPERPSLPVPGLSELPFVGQAFFRHHPLVYFTVALAFALSWFFFKSRTGLLLRAIGESPEAAFALGQPVRRIRLLSVVAGGAICGLAGAYVSLVYTPLWVEGVVAGKGWIALALTAFATWRPRRVLLGAYLFGAVTMLELHFQAEGVPIPSQFMTMLPYLSTIVALALMSRNPTWIRLNVPASLGKPFRPNA
jgi:ABC-type uncharacterized transport system permease subunit